jgi:alpha-glucosidase
MMRFLLGLSALFLAAPTLAQTRTVATAASPSGTLTLTVTTNGEGRVGYAVTRGTTPVIGESHLGFLFTDSRQMLRNMELKSQTTAARDERGSSPGASGARCATGTTRSR